MKKLENQFVLTGTVVVEPTVKAFEKASVARFALAITRTERKGDNTIYVTSQVNFEAWRKNEEAAAFDMLKKGELVTVKGFFKPEEWEDSVSHERKSRTGFAAKEFYLAEELTGDAPVPAEAQ